MIGPVLYQELLLGARRGRQHLFRRILTGWLVFQFLAFYFIYLIQSQALAHLMFNDVRVEPSATGWFAGTLFDWLMVQQLFVVLIATPALTAGAITDEKATGTLQYLLAADLTEWEILAGKLLGRAAQVVVLALCAVPLIGFVGVFAGLDLLLLAAAVGVSLVPVLGLGALSLLASVWSRQTRDAVIGVYCMLVAGALVLRPLGLLSWFDPRYALEPLWMNGRALDVARRMVVLLAVWSAVGAACLGLAVWRLRAAYVRQLEGLGRQRQRWWRVRRAAVSDEPIRWKERHVEGLAPMAFLRRVPRWLGMTLILVLTTAWSVILLTINLPKTYGWDQVGEWLIDGNWPHVWRTFESATDELMGMGMIAGLLATLLIGIRCSGAVTGERERQTWEPLLLSPLPMRQLIGAKLWGIIGASYPYLAAYALPALAAAALTGLLGFLGVVAVMLLTWLAMCFVGAAGLWCSARSKTSWRSLLSTLLIAYAGGFILAVMSFPVFLVLYGIIWATLALFDMLLGTSLALLFRTGWGLFFLSAYFVLLGIFVLMRMYFVRDAEQYIADRERVRHWKDEGILYANRAQGPRRPAAKLPQRQ